VFVSGVLLANYLGF